MNPPPLPGLKYIALLNKSSSGTTWKALQESLQREVDVKFFDPELPAAQREHDLRIARRMARLNHPNLAQVFDIISDDTTTCIIQEHISGATLAELVAGAGPLKSSQALRLIEQLVEGLDYAWQNGKFVIRNLKPQNLRTNAQGHLKISEYNLVVEIAAGTDPVALDGGHIVGTPHFISPEQAQGSSQLDFRSDMYACGAVFYFLITGRSPFEGLDNYEILQQQLSGQIAHPRSFNDQLPIGVSQILTRMMMKAPDARYASWAELSADIARVQGNKPVAKPPTSHSGSTIAAPASGAPAQKKIIASGKKPAATSAIPVRPTAAQKLGNSLRSLLWLLAALWFAWLANSSLDNPLRLPPPYDLWPRQFIAGLLARTKSAPATTDTAGESATRPGLPLLSPGEDQAAATGDNYTGDDYSSSQGEDYAAAPAAPTGTAAVTTGASLPGYLIDLGNLLRKGDTVAAAALVSERAAEIPNGTAAPLLQALRRLPTPDDAVTTGLQAKCGQEITITYMGRERQIIPNAVTAGELQAAFLTPDGSSRPITLALDKLPAAERLRLLAPAKSESDHAIHAILALQAGDTDQFNIHAPQSGPLAPVLKAIKTIPSNAP